MLTRLGDTLRNGFLLAPSPIVGRKLKPEYANVPLRDVQRPLADMGRGRRYLSSKVKGNFRQGRSLP